MPWPCRGKTRSREKKLPNASSAIFLVVFLSVRAHAPNFPDTAELNCCNVSRIHGRSWQDHSECSQTRVLQEAPQALGNAHPALSLGSECFGNVTCCCGISHPQRMLVVCSGAHKNLGTPSVARGRGQTFPCCPHPSAPQGRGKGFYCSDPSPISVNGIKEILKYISICYINMF